MPDAESDAPSAGEVWKWHWLWVTIIKAGPKRVTWRSSDGDVGSTPTDRFLLRFHRTGVTPPAESA